MIKILLEGIDGSGKTTLQYMLSERLSNEFKIIDSMEHLRREYPLTEKESLKVYGALKAYVEELLYHGNKVLLMTSEPSLNHIGRLEIREGKVKKVFRDNLGPYTMLDSYAKDRSLQNNALIFSLENKYKDKLLLLQERAFTSLVYQLAQSNDEKEVFDVFKYAISLEGNQDAIKHMFNKIIILNTSPKLAMERMGKRPKGFESEFEKKLSFLERVNDYYTLIGEKGLGYLFEKMGFPAPKKEPDILLLSNNENTKLEDLTQQALDFIFKRP